MTPPEVSASEHDLIMITRALIAPQQHDMWVLLCRSRELPPKIGPTCEALVREALGRVWPVLWRRSGARVETSIVDGRPVRGRGWERHAPLPLEFSGATLDVLRWLIATPLAVPVSTVPALEKATLTIGDQVVIYLALDAATGTSAQQMLARQPMVRAAPLAWLGFAHVLHDQPEQVDFASLAHGAGPVVVEALTRELAHRWYTLELAKRSMSEPAEIVELGATQDATLGAFMSACDKARRRDLAAFVIDAAAPLVTRNLCPAPIELDTTAPLSARAGARVAAGALLRAAARWNEWNEQHRAVRFIDDDYPAAQLLLGRFEKLGRAGADRVATWLSDLASLAPTPASATIGAG
ncbi:MAG: hypothetical protein JWO36_1712 [Myxococcales bacterium]|nr:hypothetical protein [Myxococcales bacterium]